MSINKNWKKFFNISDFEWNYKLKEITNNKDFFSLTKHIYLK